MKKGNEDTLKELFQSLDDANAPFGLEDRIMKAVKADVQQRHVVQKNLRRALAGVAATLLLFGWLIAQSGHASADVAKPWVPGLENDSGLFMIGLAFLGLLFLFLEMELVIKFWIRRRIG